MLAMSKENNTVEVNNAEKFIEILKNGSGYDKSRAAWALGVLRDERAVEPLIEFIETAEEELIMLDGIEALGKLGDIQALPALVDLLDFAEEQIQQESIQAIKKIFDHNKMGILKRIFDFQDMRAIKIRLYKIIEDEDLEQS